MRIIDLHCDTILSCYLNGDNLHTFSGHINLEKLKQGGSLAQCFALFIPTHDAALRCFEKERDPWELYQELLALYRENMRLCADTVRPAFSAADIRANRDAGYISAILTVEDCVEIEGQIERFDRVYDDGVRMMTLTWNYENCIGFPNSKDELLHTTKGLKPFGFDAVEKMNDLGIVIDVSHLSEAGFYDVASHSKKPFAASHSCCRALQDHPRNLTDRQLKTLADKGGIVGVNFYDQFLGDLGGYTTIESIVQHVLYLRKMAGIESICLGSDFDGIESALEFKDYAGYPAVIAALEKVLTDDEIDRICYGNFLRFFDDQV